MKNALLVLLLTNIVTGSVALAKQDTTSKLLVCEEMDASESDGDNETNLGGVGLTTIQLDENGAIQKIDVKRKAANNARAFHFVFDPKNFQITHIDEKTPVDENGEPTNISGIKQVETITVKNKGVVVFKLEINNHTYAGIPGSAVSYVAGKTSLSSEKLGNMVTCSGRVHSPWNTGLNLEEE